jgi:predicted alpha/beta superfamily hydrolase
VPEDRRVSGIRLSDGPIDTWIVVRYPNQRAPIGLRGDHAPLSWEHTTKAIHVDGDEHYFCVPLQEGELLTLKVVRGDDWATGRNYVVHAGDHLRLEPCFDRSAPALERGLEVSHRDRAAKLDVLLPPSYAEQSSKRYPVLYALDGQSLWSDSTDPFGIWSMDTTLASLYELDAIDELIVVGIDTSVDRLDLLSPVPDAHHGGGHGDAFLELIVDGIRPYIDQHYRTRSGSGILGSSMGGLFSFYAAWTRPDVFSKAACLSSSFWWADRWAVRFVQSSPPPNPRPFLYLDSGASPHQMEEDVRLVDGFHHTRSMHRALKRAGFHVGGEVHRLIFPGHPHVATAWASRVALPLQMMFPSTNTAIEAPVGLTA